MKASVGCSLCSKTARTMPCQLVLSNMETCELCLCFRRFKYESGTQSLAINDSQYRATKKGVFFIIFCEIRIGPMITQD